MADCHPVAMGSSKLDKVLQRQGMMNESPSKADGSYTLKNATELRIRRGISHGTKLQREKNEWVEW